MIIIYRDVSSEYLKLSILEQEVNLDLKTLAKDMLYPLPTIHEEADREYTSSRLKNVSQVVYVLILRTCKYSILRCGLSWSQIVKNLPAI